MNYIYYVFSSFNNIMEYINDLFLFFTIYSFLGWALESIFASVNTKKIINRGFLTGFVCPIYGFSAVLIIQLTKQLTNVFRNSFSSMIINILLSIVIVTILEYITGFLLEKIFNCKWWDYSDNALNFHGYICIKYSLLWGGLAFVLIQVAHPIISEIIYTIPMAVRSYLTVFLLIYFVADTSKSVVEALGLRKVILDYANISESKYIMKIIKYKRFFVAFPRLLLLNANTINHDVRRILNDRMDKVKAKLSSRLF